MTIVSLKTKNKKMNAFNLDFKETNLEAWKSQIIKELKDQDFKINFVDEIEEIKLDITQNTNKENIIPNNKQTNDWKICTQINVTSEKIANSQALKSLNQGANELIFDLKKEEINWNDLFLNIEIPFIHTRLSFQSIEQLNSFLESDFYSKIEFFSFYVDPLTNDFEEFETKLKELKSISCVAVNGFEIQQIGATTWQEIGIILSTAHELLNKGFTTNQLSLKIGIGKNYFLEIAKIRALQLLWNQICLAYNFENNIEIIAHIGWSNKSLKDPHTNLLRQTTEAMSAAIGGSNSIVIHAYDECSIDGASDFALRMATNISNILKEESYFDKVIDPLHGSVVIENLTTLIAQKAWGYFLELDKFNSLNSDSKLEKIKTEISQKARERIDKFNKNELKLIGINLFNQENPNAQSWLKDLNYLGLPYLIYEENL